MDATSIMGLAGLKFTSPLLLVLVVLLSTVDSLLPPGFTTSRLAAHTEWGSPNMEPRCFPTHAPYPLEKALIADCRQLVRDIALLDRSGRKHVFGTADAPGVEYIVPVTYSRRSCLLNIIEIESAQPASDELSHRYLSQKLSRVADWCVAPPPHLGGEVSIGPKEVLAMIVLGVEEPDRRELNGRPSNGSFGRMWDGFVVRTGERRNRSSTA